MRKLRKTKLFIMIALWSSILAMGISIVLWWVHDELTMIQWFKDYWYLILPFMLYRAYIVKRDDRKL